MGRLNDGSPSGGSGELAVGETRSWPAKDKSGEIIKTITLTRTERPYVMDLRDAYNDARSPADEARGIEWYVNAAGELKIGDSSAWSRAHARKIESRNETERARYVRHHLEHYRDAAE